MVGKYNAYPKYIDSGLAWLGEMPWHWKLHKSKYLFKRMQRPVCPEDGVITAFRDGQVTLRTNRRTDGFTQSVKEIGYQRVRVGDLLVHAMDGFAGAIGVSDSNGKCSPVCSVCVPVKPDQMHIPYYGYLVRQLAVTDFISSLAKGIRERSTEFRYSEFSTLDLAVPSLEEQEKIVNFLDHETAKIDTLIEKQQQLIKLLKEKRQAVISHAVTKGLNPNAPMRDSGVEWLGEVPEHWEVRKLKHIIASLESGVSVNTADLPAQRSELGVLKTSCVYTRMFRVEENKTVVKEEYDRVKCPIRKGAIIISRMNTPELVGASAFVDVEEPNIFLPDRLWQTVFKDEESQNPQFIAYFMMIKGFRSQISLAAEGASSSMQNIAKDDYLSINVAFPDVAEQDEIVEYLEKRLSDLKGLGKRANMAIELMQERRTALISAAVTGKIDVRSWQTPESSEKTINADKEVAA